MKMLLLTILLTLGAASASLAATVDTSASAQQTDPYQVCMLKHDVNGSAHWSSWTAIAITSFNPAGNLAVAGNLFTRPSYFRPRVALFGIGGASVLAGISGFIVAGKNKSRAYISFRKHTASIWDKGSYGISMVTVKIKF